MFLFAVVQFINYVYGHYGRSNSAEIYDHRRGIFFPCADMKRAYYNHSAVLKSDGKVAIAGYGSIFGSPSETYDPIKNKFQYDNEFPSELFFATLI